MDEVALRLPGVLKVKWSGEWSEPSVARKPSHWRNPLGITVSAKIGSQLQRLVGERFPGLNDSADGRYTPEEVMEFAQEVYMDLAEAGAAIEGSR